MKKVVFSGEKELTRNDFLSLKDKLLTILGQGKLHDYFGYGGLLDIDEFMMEELRPFYKQYGYNGFLDEEETYAIYELMKPLKLKGQYLRCFFNSIKYANTNSTQFNWFLRD